MVMKKICFVLCCCLPIIVSCSSFKNATIEELGESFIDNIGKSDIRPRFFVSKKDWKEVINQSTYRSLFSEEREEKQAYKSLMNEVNIFVSKRWLDPATQAVGRWFHQFAEQLEARTGVKSNGSLSKSLEYIGVNYEKDETKLGITFCQNVVIDFLYKKNKISLYLGVCVKTNDGWKIMYRPRVEQVLPKTPEELSQYVFDCLKGGLSAHSKFNDDDLDFLIPNLFDVISLVEEENYRPLFWFLKRNRESERKGYTYWEERIGFDKFYRVFREEKIKWNNVKNVKTRSNGEGKSIDVFVDFTHNNEDYYIKFDDGVFTSRGIVLCDEVQFRKKTRK